MSTIIISGDALAIAAEAALTGPGFETSPGYCQRWVREVVQEVAGPLFDRYWAASAAASLALFEVGSSANSLGGRYVLNPAAPILRGDLLYKAPALSGSAGHVGIMGIHGQVCENSSCHWDAGADRPDARGSRTLAAFGPFSAIVRLSLYNKG